MYYFKNTLAKLLLWPFVSIAGLIVLGALSLVVVFSPRFKLFREK